MMRRRRGSNGGLSPLLLVCVLGLLIVPSPGAQLQAQDDGTAIEDESSGVLGILRPGSGQPDRFAFQPERGLDPLSVVQTAPIELNGFDGPLLLTVEGGIDIVIVHNDRAFRNRRTLVMPGDVIVVSARSPVEFAATQEVVVTVGSFSATWQIATRDQDRLPVPINLPAVANQPPGAAVASAERIVRGFEGTVEASVVGSGEPRLRINGGQWVDRAELRPGDRVQLRVTAPAASETREVVLSVGDLRMPWLVQSQAQPATPERAPDRAETPDTGSGG